MSSISPTQTGEILDRFGLRQARIELLSNVDCTVFRVDTAGIASPLDGRPAVLKIYPPHKVDAAVVQTEVEWLLALAADTSLRVPHPIPTFDDAYVLELNDQAGSTRLCAMFSWVDGRSMDQELSPAQLRRIGAFVGMLHGHSARWRSPHKDRLTRRTFTQRALQWVLDMPAPPATLNSDEWRVLVAAAKRLQDDIATIGEATDVFGFVHSDLALSNFLFDGDQVGIIDFSDCAWGHYADDIASALVFLKHPVIGNHDHSGAYDAFRDAFLEGYQSARPLPANLEATLPTFFAARIFLVWAYIHDALTQVPWIPNAVRQCREHLERYLASAAPAPLPPRT